MREKLFKCLFRKKIKEIDAQTSYLVRQLNKQIEKNSKLEKELEDTNDDVEILTKELQQAKDEIKVYEELIVDLDKENKMMNLILQSLKLYQ